MSESEAPEKGKYYVIDSLQMAGLCIAVTSTAATFADTDGLFSIGPSLIASVREVAVAADPVPEPAL